MTYILNDEIVSEKVFMYFYKTLSLSTIILDTLPIKIGNYTFNILKDSIEAGDTIVKED